MKPIRFSIKQTVLAILILSSVVILWQAGHLLYKNRVVVVKTFSSALHVQPESFTELYFQNNETILSKPKTILNYDAVPYTFAFTIHNMENKDMHYSYEVSMVGEANKILDKQTISLKNGQSKTIAETFVLPNAILTKTKITVAILNKNNLYISFLTGGKAQ